MADWYLYILRCTDGSLYTGITTDIDRRFAEHKRGGVKGAKSLRGRRPVDIVYSRQLPSRQEALRLEAGIKRLVKYKKERLIAGDRELMEALMTAIRE